MASIMPPIPRAFFLYGEPILILSGVLNTLLKPTAITSMLPAHLARRPTSDPYPSPLEHLLALQTASIMFLVVCISTAVMLYATNARVVHGLVLSYAIADIPHWASLLYVLGRDGLSQWGTWDTSLWLQFFIPMLTMGIKVGYLTGAFGPDRVDSEGNAKEKSK
ncbi:hypothetical protein N7493_011485 [Penicillium malachiteum]|uniref:DUF7704 domain-containing protein n=1 Tax=Penicillium malachiteum TaxID=1324776 RepID=A0AAD6HAS2_9EURO|nr:hypothetical protein N7493_011485 [Penicillium malachiteum]